MGHDLTKQCLDCGCWIPERSKRCHSCAYAHTQSSKKRRCRDPNMSEKLAAMILLHLAIPHDQARAMSVDAILMLVEWDHYPVAVNTARDLNWTVDETNHPSNLQPLTPPDHLEKTRKIDTPQAAKGKRITSAQAAFRQKMMRTEPADLDAQLAKKAKWRSGRKLPSRTFRTKIGGVV